MASLNTLRTKYGIVLSVVIALVLVAFILGDQLSYRGGDEGQNQVAVKINGKAITEQQYAEYGGNMAAVVCDNFYAPEADGGISIKDESLGIDWQIPTEEALLSEKDIKHLCLKDFDSPFDYSVNLYPEFE